MEGTKKKPRVGTVVEIDGHKGLVVCIQQVSRLQTARVRDSIEITYKDMETKKVYTRLVKETWREAEQPDL